MHARSGVWTGMPAHRQAFLDQRATARTRLAGVGRGYRLHSLPGARSLESEDGEKGAPSRVRNGLGEMVVPYHVGDLQILVIDRVVLLDQSQRRLVMKI